ncbi:alpha-1,2-fucosyltransferase [Clostridioides sp. ZZV14-6045]|uniref:glycosyltransferase n=1 Tax=Clostridioides sp. ZZV14-6045 TaxID=2811489 RepID=UPI001D1177E8|nr:alpha-1,2-fucosyltransferase [Clostridioides sp. ZZV14-6045]
MNNKKICFITCVSDERAYQECIFYIENLNIPSGFILEKIAVHNIHCTSRAYNDAMTKTDARYKVYVNQNTLIINKNFIYDILGLFNSNENIGMIGMAGARKLAFNGIWKQSDDDVVTRIFSMNNGKIIKFCDYEIKEDYEIVEAIDGLIMITQYDLKWRDDIFDDVYFYDMSQSFEFKRKGYEVIIPNQENPWCIYEASLEINKLNEDLYEENRIKFLTRYYKEIFPNNVVVVRAKGGLGNQMYQYATARNIQMKTNKNLIIDTSFYKNYKLWDYGLDIFSLNKDNTVEVNVKYRDLFELGLILDYKLDGYYSDINIMDIEQKLLESKDIIDKSRLKGYYFENEDREQIFNESLLYSKESKIYLDGYFENHKYYEGMQKILREDFKVIKNINEKAKILLNDIKDENSVCLHVRRGDKAYCKETNEVHGVCSVEYFNKAVEILTSKVSNLKFYIFSDDIEWVKKNIKLENGIYVDRTMTTYNFEDFELMKNCKYFIISNSSFSWWAAWLADFEQKIVIAPQKLYAKEEKNKKSLDWTPEKWIRI